MCGIESAEVNTAGFVQSRQDCALTRIDLVPKRDRREERRQENSGVEIGTRKIIQPKNKVGVVCSHSLSHTLTGSVVFSQHTCSLHEVLEDGE